MPKSYPLVSCDATTRAELERRAGSRTEAQHVVERARIVMGCLEGRPMKVIAAELGLRANTAILWRQRFVAHGLAGLSDAPRPGRRRHYDAGFRQRLLAALEQPPPTGQAQWDAPSLARQLSSSPDAVWRQLRQEGISLQRRRSWCVSCDPDFAPKAADIVGLYLHPPENGLVVCVDEKPSIQALERRHGYVRTGSGRVVRGYQSTYRRHGTLNLFAALQVATGALHGRITQRKRRVEFLEFMDELVAELPDAQELHVVLDNYCIHKKCDAWLAAHPQVHFHFTPTSASWLNMVEIWFSLLQRQALRNGNFHDATELRQAIEAFIAAWRERAHPFVWRKREVKGAQLRNTIANLCQ